jgi:anti-sigma B factor antagonist
MLDIKKDKTDNIYYLILEGEIDAASSISLDEALNEALSAGESQIAVDCNNLNYISSAGLGVFMSHIQEMKQEGIKLVLFGVNEKVKNVFDILGLDQLIKIVGGKDEAKKYLDGV